MNRHGNRIQRLYRRLLRFYPAEFRGEFASEMARQFNDEYREADGPGARRRFVLAALLDVLITAPAELARSLRQDLRHALRLYRKHLLSTSIAVGVLAIGLAFVTAFLSLFVDLSLRPHPGFADSARIATVGLNGGTVFSGLPFGIVEDMAEEMGSIESAASSYPTSVLIGRDRSAAGIELVSAQFFSGLGARLALGRAPFADEHRRDAEPVAVISYRLWQSRYGGRTDVIGTVLEVTHDPDTVYTVTQPTTFRGQPARMVLPGEPEQATTEFRIVGVMTERLKGLAQPETALWVPLERAYSLYVGDHDLLASAGPRTYVRKRPGVHITAVRNEVEARYGDTLANILLRLDAMDGIASNIDVHRNANRQLRMFLAGGVLLALAAAANVSLFLLARAPGRRRELGIRMAVGAPVGRLARQLATESGLLVLAAAALGLALSVWFSLYFRSLSVFREAEWRQVTLLDWRVLSAVCLFLVLLTLLVSVAPILGLRRLGISASSHQAVSQASLAQRLAGTIQVGVAGALSAAAIAFAWHLGLLMFGSPGYELSDRYLARFEVTDAGARDANNAPVLAARLREAIEAIPGITGVAFGSTVPGEDQARYIARIPDPDDPASNIDGRWGFIDSHYVDLLGMRLLYGRAPEDTDRDVVLVNQTLARLWWGREDVVGEPLPFRVVYTSDGARIIGVVEDLSFTHPAAAVPPRVFTTSSYLSASYSAMLIATTMTAANLHEQLRALAASGAIEAEIMTVQPLKLLRDELLAPDRARSLLTVVTAVLVVLLSAFGFYGTQRYLVAAGRRHYAIRASFGAGPRALWQLVLRRSLRLGLPGIALGAMLAFIVAAWLRSDYVSRDVSPSAVAICVIAGLASILLAASLAPAAEARRTQPAALLREE